MTFTSLKIKCLSREPRFMGSNPAELMDHNLILLKQASNKQEFTNLGNICVAKTKISLQMLKSRQQTIKLGNSF